MSWPEALTRQAVRVLDAVLPPRCLACGGPVDHQGGTCPDCWVQLSLISPPFCAACGQPFEVEALAGALCGACLSQPPAFDRARAAVIYDDASRRLVLGLKYGDQTYTAAGFGLWLARAGAELLAGASLLVPVPLHRWRLFLRRYNQAALLAEGLHRATGICHVPDLLVRHQMTPPQGKLSREGRRRNVAGAFRLRRGAASRVQDARIVLIDDVLTTGATVNACAAVLKRAGAARVDVLTLARATKVP